MARAHHQTSFPFGPVLLPRASLQRNHLQHPSSILPPVRFIESGTIDHQNAVGGYPLCGRPNRDAWRI